MDKIINFLLDYYIWILAVLGIAIITVIGFLVDSNKKRTKNKEISVDGTVANEVKTVEPLPDNNISNPIVDAGIMNQQVLSGVNNSNIGNQQLQTQSVQVSQELPVLNEQKPHFETSQVNVPVNSNVNQSIKSQPIAPKPVNAIPINMTTQVNQQAQSVQNPAYNSGNQPIQRPVNYNLQSSQNGNYQTLNAHPVQQQNQVQGQNMNNSQVMNKPQMSNIQNSQIPNQNYSQNQIYNQNVGQVNGVNNNNFAQYGNVSNPQRIVNQSNMTQNTQVSQPQNFGINFVTGNTSVNNTSSDTWNS